ncbi:MAG: hypothetical protein ACR2O4_07365 [Hyphomicrobiaceae bacterium]
MRVAWSVKALADYGAIIDYLEETAPEAAPLVVDRIRHAEEIILAAPVTCSAPSPRRRGEGWGEGQRGARCGH